VGGSPCPRCRFIFPVVVGAGERLFGETSASKPFRLTGSRIVGDGLVFVSYVVDREPAA
jgi:hypothetical protein